VRLSWSVGMGQVSPDRHSTCWLNVASGVELVETQPVAALAE